MPMCSTPFLHQHTEPHSLTASRIMATSGQQLALEGVVPAYHQVLSAAAQNDDESPGLSACSPTCGHALHSGLTVGMPPAASSGSDRMRRLHALMQRLVRERRQEVIRTQFTQEQRLLLENWIISNWKAEPKMRQQGRKRSEKGNVQLDKPERRDAVKPSRRGVVGKTIAATGVNGSTRGVIRQCRKGVIKYYAVALCERLELRTREVESSALAVRFRLVLLDLKVELGGVLQHALQKYLQGKTASVDLAAAELLPHVVRAASRCASLHLLDADLDLGLRFRLSLPSRCHVGLTSLNGPVFRLSRGLFRGLLGWCEVQAARFLGDAAADTAARPWLAVREAFVRVWESAGRDAATLRRHLREAEAAAVSRRSLKRSAAEEAQKKAAVVQDHAAGKSASKKVRHAAAVQHSANTSDKVERQISSLLKKWAAELVQKEGKPMVRAKRRRQQQQLRQYSAARCVGCRAGGNDPVVATKRRRLFLQRRLHVA
eukprot:TRINITY_DN41287_c0_g1_i1.p1 TRINITY_DN41287_c0_g1~~TRINITY_DN41287_c0_g1_i1.p1  ORF type:complete len:488 (+),score=87.67 TRINITY_DN41287_c0_g1_i1:268-1731(+)